MGFCLQDCVLILAPQIHRPIHRTSRWAKNIWAALLGIKVNNVCLVLLRTQPDENEHKADAHCTCSPGSNTSVCVCVCQHWHVVLLSLQVTVSLRGLTASVVTVKVKTMTWTGSRWTPDRNHPQTHGYQQVNHSTAQCPVTTGLLISGQVHDEGSEPRTAALHASMMDLNGGWVLCLWLIIVVCDQGHADDECCHLIGRMNSTVYTCSGTNVCLSLYLRWKKLMHYEWNLTL